MNQSWTQLIRQRFSCRRYREQAIATETQQQLQKFLDEHQTGPFGSRVKLSLIAANEQDRQSLKGVGTYGVIKHAQGFIIGAIGSGDKNLEDFGYVMEEAILAAADLGLGTCWLVGSFTKSSFAHKIGATEKESVPAVTSTGYIADQNKADELIRRRIDGALRLPAGQLFFDGQFGISLPANGLGEYAAVLDSVRWAPSASNKQPWRIICAEGKWHFYLQRTPNYGRDSWLGRLIGVADVQRMDMGIAMCHFAMTAGELGLIGEWRESQPDIELPDSHTSYVVSWVAR